VLLTAVLLTPLQAMFVLRPFVDVARMQNRPSWRSRSGVVGGDYLDTVETPWPVAGKLIMMIPTIFSLSDCVKRGTKPWRWRDGRWHG